ncbi:MAG TPA: cyclodeaminase/cyclohydrolase family protein [Gaiellaceae bacterium]
MAKQGGRAGGARTSAFSAPQDGAEAADLLDLSLGEFLDAVSSEDPTPGGGSAAALAVAVSAGLTAMVARGSAEWADAGSAIAQAERLRKRVAPLAQQDAEAYEEALVTMTLPERVEPAVRDMAVGAALTRAAEVPMAIAEAGADAACLAAWVADRGNAARRGDAVTAALLAEAGARAAANLVTVNLLVKPGDERALYAELLAKTASEAARQAVRTTDAA